MSKKTSFIFLIIFFALSTLFFHNCGKALHTGSYNASSLACIQIKLLPEFERTYYKFFATTGCRGCHAPGTGYNNIPHFAQPNSSLGLKAFTTVGTNTLKNKLKITHNGFSWSEYETELSAYEQNWNAAINDYGCNNDPNSTSEKTIEFYEPHPNFANKNRIKASMKTPQTITWDLNHRIKGVSISVDVKANGDEFDYPINFSVNNLKVKSSQNNIRVGKITVLINQKSYGNTTFSQIDEQIGASDDFVELGVGGATSLITRDESDTYLNSDGWSLKIDLLEIAD